MFTLSNEQLIDIFKRRVSTRAYDPTKTIPADTFRTILECGRLSPSSVGSEPWQFLVIQNKELRAKLKPVAWGMTTQIDDCSHLVCIVAKKNARYDTDFFQDVMDRRGLQGEQRMAAMAKYKSFQEDDADILASERSVFDWASKQTYIALANMMTGAALIGIDSYPIEGFNYAEVNRILVEEGLFDPKEWGVSVMATFGYRAKEIKSKYRKPLTEIVEWVE